MKNRLTCAWVPGGTESFRNMSRMHLKKKKGENVMGNYGTNCQNLSDEVSRIVVADEGKELISADLAGAEALIVAYICPNGNYRGLFNAGIKPHVFTAFHFFHEYWQQQFTKEHLKPFLALNPAELKEVPFWNEVLSPYIKKDKIKYFIGKKGSHSFNYDKKPNSFRFDVLKESEGKIVIPLRESERLYGVYHSIFPEIQKSFHRETDMLLRTTRILFNMFGFPREFYYEKLTDKLLREAIAWRPQSTIGCLTNIAYCQGQTYVEDNDKDWDLLNNKHDSIMIQAPPKDRDEVIALLRKTLEVTFTNDKGETFKMGTEIKVGKNWGDWHEKDNPEGMKEI